MLFKASMRSVSSVYRKSEPLSRPLHLQVSPSHSRASPGLPFSVQACSSVSRLALQCPDCPSVSRPALQCRGPSTVTTTLTSQGTLSLWSLFRPVQPVGRMEIPQAQTGLLRNMSSVPVSHGNASRWVYLAHRRVTSALSQLPPPPFTLTVPSLTVLLLPSPQPTSW